MTSHEQTLLEASEALEKTAAALENLRAQVSNLQTCYIKQGAYVLQWER